ncbi:hypothetical protein BVC80_1787g37 [Macleaya cordata]|uniref:Uncharacterized protein n=1 Tax=Macleaya cordata TaxID=56857 RepID=A0A200QU15_MACCD|nr:hypothetical protein BVC80_1787g37 [Macleaya cordata]
MEETPPSWILVSCYGDLGFVFASASDSPLFKASKNQTLISLYKRGWPFMGIWGFWGLTRESEDLKAYRIFIFLPCRFLLTLLRFQVYQHLDIKMDLEGFGPSFSRSRDGFLYILMEYLLFWMPFGPSRLVNMICPKVMTCGGIFWQSYPAVVIRKECGTGKDNEGPDLMIRLCTCSGGSASTLELSRNRVAVASCKICGRKPLVDGRGSLSGSMLSTVGLELSTVFNPDLTWKTVSKGNRSATRRARKPIARSVEGSAKPVAGSVEGSEKEVSKRLEDMPVSESEKLGVTVLGRRFSDKIEHVPIKKRRFLFRSPSPPPRIPSPRQQDSGWILNSQPALGHKESSPNSTAKERVMEIATAVANELGQVVNVDGKSLKEIHGKLVDHEDFSGISILAAAACNNNIEGGASNDEDGTTDEKFSVREGSLEVLAKSKSRLVGEESCIDDSQNCAEISNGETDFCISAMAMEETSTSPKTSKDCTKNMATMARDVVDGKNMGSPVSQGHSTTASLNLPSDKDDRTLRKLESASRDDRLHWDLNIVMDAWENPCEDSIVDSQTNSVHGTVSDDSMHGENVQRGSGDLECAIEKTVQPLVEGPEDINRLEDSRRLVPGFHESNREMHKLDACKAADQASSFQGKVRSLEIDNATKDLVKETKLVCDQETLDSNAVDDACVNHFLPAEAESITCKPLSEETRNEASQIDICKQTEGGRGADAVRGEAVTSMSPQSEKCDAALSDSVVSKRASPKDENAGRNSDLVVVDGYAPKLKMSLDVINGEAVQPGPLNNDMGISDGSGVTLAPPNCEDGRVSAKYEVNLGTNDVALVHGESEKPTHKLSRGTPEVVESQTALGSLSSDEACRSYDNPVNSPGKVALEDPFDDSDYDSDVSHDGPEHVPEIEKKAIELQAGYDSQYEDGELRESTEHNWEDAGEEVEAEHVDYGSDNRETYGFEAPEDYLVSVSVQVAKGADCRKERYAEVDNVNFEGDQFKKKANCKPFIEGLLNGSVMEHGSGKERTVKSVKQQSRGNYATDDIAKLKMDAKVDGESSAAADKVIQEDDSCARNAAKESSQLARMKLSGWDKLPEGCQSSADTTTDAREGSGKNNAGPHVDGMDYKYSITGVAGPIAPGRELPSFIEGPTSSDTLLRKDRACIHANRSNNFDDSNPRVEMDTGSAKSIGRGGSSMHMHGRGRGSDRWVDSSRGNWGQNRLSSPSYYGPANFVHPPTNNAAAAAAAKVESNGFIVAPDGTIIKPGAVGPSPSGRVQRQSVNASSQVGLRSITRRGSPTDRDETFGMHMGLGPVGEINPDRSNSLGRGRSGRYGPRVVRTGPRERYNGSLPDDGIDSSLRRQSFSPIHRRGAPHLSQPCTRSRSRSRTRSPNMWPSPRGRCSRSPPNFRSETRMDRGRSPHRRPGFEPDHIVGFASIPRRRDSPQHASRWIDDRKDGMDHFREHGYNKRSSASGRGSPGRIFRRSHRFELVDSSERLRPDEYYNRPMHHPGRFSQVVGTGRRPRYDGSDDDKRKHGDRCGMVHPIRRYDTDGPMKRFQYDVEDGFAARNSRNKDISGFHGRGNPKEDYVRGIDSRLGDTAPRGAREEKGHFRYGRDGKYDANSKSFGVRECEDDIAPKRRRP